MAKPLVTQVLSYASAYAGDKVLQEVWLQVQCIVQTMAVCALGNWFAVSSIVTGYHIVNQFIYFCELSHTSQNTKIRSLCK